MTTVLVTGAAGFIGSHLCTELKAWGYHVIGADIRWPEFGPPTANDFNILDVRHMSECLWLCAGVDEVYHLAADMGGMGYLHDHHADVMRDNTRININVLEAARIQGVKRLLFTSSACVYPEYRQMDSTVQPLKEADAYPAQPDLGYGWEKLYAEQVCHYYRAQYGLETRIGRLHNVYGPLGTWRGGREKAPAALCRKIATAKLTGVGTSRTLMSTDQFSRTAFDPGLATIDVWGDGEQTRSFTYIDDCVEGLHRLMRSDYAEPVNIGSSELVTINELVDTVADIAGVTVEKRYDLSKPQGVRGRNSDNTLCRDVLGWEPTTSLRDGLAKTYPWIEEQVLAVQRATA